MDAQYTFREGDLVCLKTGGPTMVVRFPVQQLLLCAWVDAGGRTRRGTFAPDQLEGVYTVQTVVVRLMTRLATRWRVVAEC